MIKLPTVNATRCTGCGDCVIVCPTQCLNLADLTPRLPRPHECIACSLCVLVCPTDAIRIDLDGWLERTFHE